MSQRVDADRKAELAQLATLARSQTEDSPSTEALLAGERRFVASLGKQPRRATPWILAAAALAATIAFVVWPSRDIRYRVEGGVASEQGYVRASGTTSVALAFSEGTSVLLAPGGRARVASTSPHGAKLVLEDGLASIHVVHFPDTAWSIEAGPFTVEVRGTTFDLRWSAADEVLTLTMREGTVVVRGGATGNGVSVEKGQALVVRTRDRDFQVSAWEDAGVEAPRQALPAATPDVIELEPTPAPVDAGRRRASSDWPEQVAKGNFDGVLASADARGIDSTLENASLADLGALADAARYGGRRDLAKRTLLAERSRFKGAPEAATASFLLGRSADDVDHATGEALRWYDAYLAEAPTGPLADETLGRKMSALRSLGREGEARVVAKEYLAKLPNGPYSAVARDLVTPR